MNGYSTRFLLGMTWLLFGCSLSAVAESQMSDERAAELRKYIESQRTATTLRLQSEIDGLRRMQAPGPQKAALRKAWTKALGDCKSPNFIPSLNLESPKGIGWVVLDGESAEGVYGRVVQVVGPDEFILSIHRKDSSAPSGTYSGADLGRAVQNSLLNPAELDLGQVWVKGSPTGKITEGKSINIKAVFVVDGNKTYSTITGRRKTVPEIHRVTDLSKIIAAKPTGAGVNPPNPSTTTEQPGEAEAIGEETTAEANVIFSDNFESESRQSQKMIVKYSAFQNWDVIGSGGVDLIGPNGGYPARIDSQMVDLDGYSGSELITKKTFDLSPGTYTLTFDLHGPAGGKAEDSVVVGFGETYSQHINVKKDAPKLNHKRTIVVKAPAKGKLSFKDLGADANGAFLDNVKITFIPAP